MTNDKVIKCNLSTFRKKPSQSMKEKIGTDEKRGNVAKVNAQPSMIALINLFHHIHVYFRTFLYDYLTIRSTYFVCIFSHHWPDEVPFVLRPSSAHFRAFGKFIK